ncbi:MAG: hypothetical protein AAGA58_08925 [Verrucomicrobiota bacterium]
MKIPFVTFIVLVSAAMATLVVGEEAKKKQKPQTKPKPAAVERELPKQLRVVVEFFEVEALAALDVLSEPRDNSSDDDLHARVMGEVLADNGEIRLLDMAVITTRSGQRAKVESVEEMIYATEYDPAEIAVTEEVAGEGAEGLAAVTPPSPTAFECRNVGVTVEVDPVLSADGSIVEVNIAPEVICRNEDSVFSAWETDHAEMEVIMPNFYTVKFSTALSVVPGHPHLAAVMSPRNDDGQRDGSRKILAFVRVDVLTVGE